MRLQRLSGGFTLVEASITVAIAAITLATAAPSFGSFIETRRLNGVAAQLAADIQFIRAEALLRNAPLRLSLHDDAGGNCYVLHSGLAKQCSCAGDGPALCSGDAREIKTVVLPARERIRVQANVASILFDPLHGTSTPTGTLRVVADSGRAVHHVVNIMGRVRTCSPAGAAPVVAGYRVC
jgi:type IV fimbrial biogenesis protein FimT